jgi:hypothetical protein
MLGTLLASAALACGVPSGAVHAAPTTLRLAVPDAAALEPGFEVRVSWSLEAGEARRDFDEMELVLSLDGGRTFPLRVTRRIAPNDGGTSWRVPSLPTAHARLALRAGEDERPGQERVVGVSEEFRIRSEPSAAAEELFQVGDEERTLDALDGAPPPAPPDSSVDGPPDSLARADSFDLPARGHAPDSDFGHALAAHQSRTSATVPLGAPGGLWPLSAVRLPLRL